jgi:hypothetical protein
VDEMKQLALSPTSDVMVSEMYLVPSPSPIIQGGHNLQDTLKFYWLPLE